MANIQDAREAAAEFLRGALNAQEVRVIAVAKVEDGWEATVEAYEENTFLKSLGLPSRVQDMNTYALHLTNALEVESYERREHPAISS